MCREAASSDRLQYAHGVRETMRFFRLLAAVPVVARLLVAAEVAAANLKKRPKRAAETR